MKTTALQPHPIAERYPLLSGEDFEAFKASIQANGQRVKVILFEGKILDGRNRYRACAELGVEPLTETFTGTEREAEVLADVLNLDRRHLTREQKRAVIAFKLKVNPEQSDRSIAEEVKVDHKTVAAVRRSVASTGEFPQLSPATRKGRDGRHRRATQPQKPTIPPAGKAIGTLVPIKPVEPRPPTSGAPSLSDAANEELGRRIVMPARWKLFTERLVDVVNDNLDLIKSDCTVDQATADFALLTLTSCAAVISKLARRVQSTGEGASLGDLEAEVAKRFPSSALTSRVSRKQP